MKSKGPDRSRHGRRQLKNMGIHLGFIHTWESVAESLSRGLRRRENVMIANTVMNACAKNHEWQLALELLCETGKRRLCLESGFCLKPSKPLMRLHSGGNAHFRANPLCDAHETEVLEVSLNYYELL